MKKKISVLLCVLVAMLCFTACGSKKENLQYDKSTITQATDFLIEYCNSADADTIEQWNKMTDFQIESQLNQAGVPFTKDSFLAALDAWQQGTKECGEYVSHGDYKFEPSSDELKVTTSAKFKDRDADITFVFDEDLYLDSTTIDARYSIGEIMEKALAVSVGMASPARIDEINILQATYEAMREAIAGLKIRPQVLLNDAVKIPQVEISQVPIIKGDAKSLSIAAASVIAKVTRDRLMKDYDKLMPEYGFAKHKGYGSAAHMEAIRKFGSSPIHRQSFIKNII